MLSIGIVGLPNVGKSTLFKTLTNKQVDIQNYPFTTIDPNVGVVAVPDERVDALAQFSNSKKKIYATVDFIDIAGLVKGASQGEGLGNKFLANIREVDAIVHVVRVFEDKKITHIHNKIDPSNDIEIIQTELELADLQTKEKREKETLRQTQGRSAQGKDLPALNLLIDKKVIFILNASETQITESWQPDEKLLKIINGRNYIILSLPLELIMSEATKEERKEYFAEFNIPESGLDKLIKTGYKTLGLLTFLTTGEDESRAWTAHIGNPIPKASRAIHTDFEKLFIRAEIINWKTLIESGSYANARAKGLIRTVGRDYVIQEGDVVEIKI